MAESRDHNQFKLITPERINQGDVGEDVTLSCHLSPETSAVTMIIMWFKETECIYLYKNGQVTERRGYEGRLSLITQEMERGNVFLRMKNIKETDGGRYICQVIHGEQKEEALVGLRVSLGKLSIITVHDCKHLNNNTNQCLSLYNTHILYHVGRRS
uniref:Ig-like domain-containing protein n=1 Tax=Esox lucius TaxID=8010 RepID=A0A3P8XPI5_ESOLU